MIIKKIYINKFRGFNEVGFSLGKHVTLIAGQNGTQKSTLLGILSQTFTIPNEDHVFSEIKPLTGGSFRSSFQEKFRLSPTLDVPGEHEWSLFFHDHNLHQDINEQGSFTVESITRKDKGKESLRFWQQGKRGAGNGYIQLPVIYLSLKRLIPIAEAGKVNSKDIELTDKEKTWFETNYNKILFSRDNLESIDYLESRNKNTLGVSTNHYDWHSNSAGQDNLGKILLSVISFQRLKNDFPDDYKGGILAIDEIDATLYPGSQVKLLELLSKFCEQAKIQLIATTHSLQLLEKIEELKESKNRSQDFNTVYLTKQDEHVIIEESPSFSSIIGNLNLKMGIKPIIKKIPIYTEDEECIHFVKAILGRQFSNLTYPKVKLGCNNYIELGKKKVPNFTLPNSIIVLDGDAQKSVKKSKLKNFICLPGILNPESMLANFLHNLSDTSPFWKERHDDYCKQICFGDYTLDEITNCRVKAKKWYNSQLSLEGNVWGQQASLVFRYFLKTIENEKLDFINQFEPIYQKVLNK